MTALEYARAYVAAGISILPIRTDHSKAPIVSEMPDGKWKYLQSRLPTASEIERLFGSDCGLAAIGGKVSGNLEIYDFDDADRFAAWSDLVKEHLGSEFYARLLIVRTPRPGFHVYTRCSAVGGNQKLAMRLQSDGDGKPELKALIEIKAEGGYVLLPGCPPECHITGNAYQRVQGTFTAIPEISPAEREVLYSCCRSFNEYAPEESKIGASKSNGHLRPGDDYNQRGDALGVLAAHGWTVTSRRGDTVNLKRPGKKEPGISATFGHVAPNTLYVFSSSAYPFEMSRAYDAFGVFARLEHAGEIEAATKALGQLGYGELPAKPKTGKLLKPPNGMPADAETVVPDSTTRITPNSWMKLGLDLTDKGAPIINMNNVVKILRADDRLKDLLWYDEFLGKIMTGTVPREWKDNDEVQLLLYLQSQIGLTRMRMTEVTQAVHAVALSRKKNCVQQWMSSIEWDHTPRINQFFSDHFGASHTSYTIGVGRNFWLSLVARVYRPGCQVDNMLVLEGPQGIGKSRAMRAIGGEWYAEQHESASNPRAFAEILQGKLLVEISEMDSFSRVEVTRVKQVVGCTSDRYRAPYSRNAEDHPRQCVFVGTTNRDDWNHDETGARRFWPIACIGEVDVQAITKYRDQYFAEALHRFNAGDLWWEMPAIETRNQQEARFDADVWRPAIAEYIQTKSEVSTVEILTDLLRFQAKECDKRNQMRVAGCLRSLGWIRATSRLAGRVQKVWLPPDTLPLNS